MKARDFNSCPFKLSHYKNTLLKTEIKRLYLPIMTLFLQIFEVIILLLPHKRGEAARVYFFDLKPGVYQ
jgi:hypothetical protein